MPTMEDYLTRPVVARLEPLRTTPDELAAEIRGRSDAILSSRPDGRNWSAKEIVCHLRDVEELFYYRLLDSTAPAGGQPHER